MGTGYRRSVLHSYRWNKKQILKNGDWVVVHSWSKSPVKIGTRFIERIKDSIVKEEFNDKKEDEDNFLMSGEVKYSRAFSSKDII